MSRFPLAGLLRLRQVQEDLAAADLSRATAAARSSREAAEAARRNTRPSVTTGAEAAEDDRLVTAQQFTATAATFLGRAAYAGDLATVSGADRALVTASTAAWASARADHEAVESLRGRHLARERAERAAAEQSELDDHVAAGWARGGSPALPSHRRAPGQTP